MREAVCCKMFASAKTKHALGRVEQPVFTCDVSVSFVKPVFFAFAFGALSVAMLLRFLPIIPGGKMGI